VVRCVVNSRHTPARAPHMESYQRPATSDQEARKTQTSSTRTLCTHSAHPYQNKGFANQNNEFLSPLFSHTCAHLRLQTLCFETLHKNTRGEGVTPVTTVPSRNGIGGGARDRWEGSSRPVEIAGRRENFLFWGGFMSDMNVRPPKDGHLKVAATGSWTHGRKAVLRGGSGGAA